MSAAEYRDWRKFYAANPWGCVIDDQRFGLLASLLISTQGGKYIPAQEFFVRTIEDDDKIKENRQALEEAQLRMDLMGYQARYEHKLANGGIT
jgi:hypothetical protein